ncbi:glycosyltransferase family 2 protein [uncultured Shimia sp.]|uniref:glycosyltransferase family 2 protein n=1 Tax=uncultured Shimia sp. TaxID=573152 RepID=UPI002620769B|nr:glycosyltransferase family 2 protein [uncultured Shimia sp.]
MTRWGIVATIKAPAREVLSFVAYHLDLGADHLFIYLDNHNPRAEAALAAHPQVTVTRTDGDYWAARGRQKPAKHQVRQTVNATHTYATVTDLDWLLHIDVDEFLCPNRPVHEMLEDLAPDVVCARVHPAEALATDGQDGLDPSATYCKGWMSNDVDRRRLEQELYPSFGKYMRGGFVSHFIGKIFVRTGLSPLMFRIHRGTIDGEEIAPQVALHGIDLCHMHITDWASWQKVFDYRLDKGSYRSDLNPTRDAGSGGLSMHDLFSFLIEDGGEAALRRFFDEVCLARPELLESLRQHDLLRVLHLDLDAKRKRIFPDWRK